MIEQPQKNIQWVHLAPATDDDHDRVRATTTVCNGSNGLTLVTLSLWLLVFPCVAMAGGGGLVQTAVVDASTVFVVVFYFVVSYFVVSYFFSNHAFEFGPRQRRPLKSSAELIKCSRGEPDTNNFHLLQMVWLQCISTDKKLHKALVFSDARHVRPFALLLWQITWYFGRGKHETTWWWRHMLST